MISSNKKISPNECCAEDIFNDCVKIVKNKLFLAENVSPEFIFEIEKIVGFEIEVRYISKNEICPDCGSKLNKNGPKARSYNKIKEIEQQQYACTDKKCNYFKIVDLSNFISKGCTYSNNLRLEGVNELSIEYKSFEKISESINDKYNVKISRSAVFYHYMEKSEIFIENNNKKIDKLIDEENIKHSGVFHYDEQFPNVNGEQKVRLILMDAKYKLIIDQITIPQENFNKNFVKEFLVKNTRDMEVKGIVTDGDTSYPEIIDKIATFHQQCHFHKMQNLMNPVNKIINKNKRKIKKLNLKKEKLKKRDENLKSKNKGKKGRISKKDKQTLKNNEKRKQIKKELKIIKKELKECEQSNKELNKYVDKISLLLKSKSIKTMHNRLNKLFKDIKKSPKVIKKFLKGLNKNFNRISNHLRCKELPRTNNTLEGYIGITLPQNLKKKYRTDKGLEKRQELSNIRWTKRNSILSKHFQ